MSEHIESQQSAVPCDELVIREPDNNEDNGQHGEAHELDRLSANGVYESDGHPVTRNRPGADDNQLANSGVVESLVYCITLGITDCAEDDGLVEPETIESNLCQVSIIKSSPC